MALEFSRCVEELVATRVFITSTEGFVDISSLGSQGEGGLVSVGARTIRLDSDGGQVSIGHGEGAGAPFRRGPRGTAPPSCWASREQAIPPMSACRAPA